MNPWLLAISLLMICGVFISRSKEDGVWVIERNDDSLKCWINQFGEVTFNIIFARCFFSEQEAKREIELRNLSVMWQAVEKGGSS